MPQAHANDLLVALRLQPDRLGRRDRLDLVPAHRDLAGVRRAHAH
ncbi:hypothetical protein [Aromatoleum sp.]